MPSPVRYLSEMWLCLMLLMVITSAAESRRDIDQFYADPTILTQFVPLDMASARFSSGGGFLNQHITMFAANTQGQRSANFGSLSVQLDNSGHYSHIYHTGSPTSGVDAVKTSMSCTRISQDGSQYTCTWIESTAVVILDISTITWTYTTTEVAHTKTTTNTWTTWSDLPPVTSSGVFDAGQHVHTITMDGMIRPRTAESANASPSVSAVSNGKT
jgi:hypothetical protein